MNRKCIMYHINFDQPIHVHFIGIGGISMSGLAEVLLKQRFTVSGSDARQSALTLHLEKLGAAVIYGQSAKNITKDIDAVVYTAAIHPDNPELCAAQDYGIPCITRAELLGQIMRNYRTPVAVSGTHGKTTTTSMISEILMQADTDPTLSIGGILPSINGNIRVGSSFRKFASLLPPDGTLIINGDIPDLPSITDGLSCKVITYGSRSSCDYFPLQITYDDFANPTYYLCHNESREKITLSVPGEHNVYNSMAAAVLADVLDIPMDDVRSALKNFRGTQRRFQYKGKRDGVTIIDDYAHHPTEISATLSAAGNYPHKKLWCVFQPHTYTRTKAFLSEFARSLSAADHVVLADIYAARETDNLGISSQTLQKEILALGTACDYFPSFEEIENFLKKNFSSGDLLITMGAGDVVNIGENLLKE